MHLHVFTSCSRNACTLVSCLLPGEGIQTSFLATFEIPPCFHVILLMSPRSFNSVKYCMNLHKPRHKSTLLYSECAAHSLLLF